VTSHRHPFHDQPSPDRHDPPGVTSETVAPWARLEEIGRLHNELHDAKRARDPDRILKVMDQLAEWEV